MASESEQGHVGCIAKRRTGLARPAFVSWSGTSLTGSNRRIRNRTCGGVGGADERLSPLARSGRADPTFSMTSDSIGERICQAKFEYVQKYGQAGLNAPRGL